MIRVCLRSGFVFFGEWLFSTVDYSSFCLWEIGLLVNGFYDVNFLFLFTLNAREYFRSYVCSDSTGVRNMSFEDGGAVI